MIETSNGVSTSKTTQIDQWGRLTEYQQITDGQTYTSKYSYNLSGALIEEEYPSGKKVKNDFDANGDVERVWGTNGASNIPDKFDNLANHAKEINFNLGSDFSIKRYASWQRRGRPDEFEMITNFELDHILSTPELRNKTSFFVYPRN